MKYLWLLLPAIGWGILPLIVVKTNSKVVNQIFGTAVGTLIVSVFVMIILRPSLSVTTFIMAAVAGAMWIVGQLGQYTAYQRIGVSQTMPISTGLQLVGTSLVGVFIFGEWATTTARIAGFVGIALLIVGAVLTSINDHGEANNVHGSKATTLLMLLLTTIGYVIYNAIPRALTTSGIAIFFPESVGMVIGVLIYIFATHRTTALREPASWRSLIIGFVFSIASLTYILSVRDNGVNTAFVVSQLSVVISTLGGFIFLHERKSKRGYIFTSIGLVLIVVGAIITSVF
ncbi:GRP family sugar transporter [Limosilactobacillus reuteri]|uniref:GRP family sugar transporter n=1 Tax=Limosilactobacillus reuteri TaxID=1598 RepID=UPI001E57F3BC|nr:GRP family sugar transporter [Limosilactobacillus reuteri]MCC4422543.1 GRP family sugar transporter [Limosilactobacillus reuteri]